MTGPLWETVTVVVILVGLLAAYSFSGDRLDHWTFRGEAPKAPKPLRVYGMTLRQIRKLRDFYVSRTGDRFLENLG